MGISDRVELRHLRAFVAVAEELNFRAAADRLHLTQPPLSRTIAQLEDVIGKRLLKRDTHRCQLTVDGEVFLASCKQVLHLVENSLAAIRTTGVSAPASLKIGVTFTVNAAKLPGFVNEVRNLTGIRPDMRLGRSQDLIRLTSRGEIDASLVMLPVENPESVRLTSVGTAEMLAAIPAEHELARQQTVTLNDLHSVPEFLFISRTENPPLYAHLDAELKRREFRPRYTVPRDTFEGLAQIAAGVACALAPSTFDGFENDRVALRRFHVADRILLEIGLATNSAVSADIQNQLACVARTFFGSVFPVERATS
jgi:DNA-binding transcriptional LysR family regulator